MFAGARHPVISMITSPRLTLTVTLPHSGYAGSPGARRLMQGGRPRGHLLQHADPASRHLAPALPG
jgi:hypothetical protein